MVCPTCFCTTVEDGTDLAGESAERTRRWDSCFTIDFSYVHGGSVRLRSRSRYRQWMTHKLATWIDQFGSSGCVGCGRCITWCPVAIDITEEVAAIRADPTRLNELLSEIADVRRARAAPARADRRLRREPRPSRPASTSLSEGDPADTFFVDPPRPGRARARRARRAAR